MFVQSLLKYILHALFWIEEEIKLSGEKGITTEIMLTYRHPYTAYENSSSKD
jgi:hypothetical protein